MTTDDYRMAERCGARCSALPRCGSTTGPEHQCIVLLDQENRHMDDRHLCSCGSTWPIKQTPHV